MSIYLYKPKSSPGNIEMDRTEKVNKQWVMQLGLEHTG